MGNSWKKEKIGNIAIINLDTFSPKENWEFVNYLDTGNITEGNISNIQKISDIKTLPSRARRKIQADDIVYSTVRPNQKHYGIISTPLENMLVSTGFSVIRGIEYRCNTKFLYYFLTQQYIMNRLQTIAEHSTSAYPSIRPADIESLEINLPPISEQKAIAHILGSLDDKIELNRQMNETLEAMAKAIFKSWFVDFDPVRAKVEGRDTGLPKEIADLFPDCFEDSELGEIPRGWKSSTIGNEFNLTMGQSPPGETYNEIGEGAPFFQGRKDFNFRYPTKRVYCSQPRRLAKHGDTLVSVRAPVGAINMSLEECCVGRGVAAIRHKSQSRSYTYYAMHTLKHRFSSFETNGTVFGAINKKQFEGLKWITASQELIDIFENILFPVDDLIEKNTFDLNNLSTIRDTLLPKLISGELRIPDADKFINEAGL